MTNDDGLSSFESLLLVQTLAAHGPNPEVFEKISNSLKESKGVLQEPGTIDRRFSEKSLRDQYISLLKQEAKHHLHDELARDQATTNGATDEATEDRQQRPNLPDSPNLANASQYAYLLPQLVVKLYNAYKEQVVREIREEERRYDELLRQIDSAKVQIGASGHAQDTRTLAQEPASSAPTSGLQDVQTRQTTAELQARPSPRSDNHMVQTRHDFASPRSAPRLHTTVEQMPQIQSQPPAADASIRSILNTPVPEKAVSHSPKRTVDGMRKPSQPPTPATARRVLPAIAPAGTPYLPPLQPNLAGYRPPSDLAHSPYDSRAQSTGSAISSQTSLQPAWNQAVQVANGQPFPQLPSAQWAQTQGYPQSAVSPHPLTLEEARRQSLPPLDQNAQQGGVPGTPQTYPLRQPQYPPSGYPQQQPSMSNPAARGGGVMLPPFQVTPQASGVPNANPAQQSSIGSVAQRLLPRLHGTPIAGQDRGMLNANEFTTPVSIGQQTPFTGSGPPRFARPGVTFSPNSTTGWKIPQSAVVVEVERPGREFLERITPEPEATPKPALISVQKAKASPRTTKQSKDVQNPPVPAQPLPTQATPAQPTPTPAVGKRGKGARAPSVTRSVTATSTKARTRSQSIASQSDDNLKSRMSTDRAIKPEPSTPAAMSSETPVPVKTRRTTKTPTSIAPQTNTKRKRAPSADLADPLEASTPRPAIPPHLERAYTADQTQTPSNPTTITAFRNFQKMTQPIMNNITSHKHASLFANPVKDRDAEGYSDIIKQSQDLKSIRAAIVAGSRTVTALTTGDGTGTPAGTPRARASTPGGSGAMSSSATVVLPYSQDLVPPRAIVNGAQLEQEVMRMFANAVMFNAGDEGVVRDTREMFESVEASIAAWRAAERNVSEQRGSGLGIGGVAGALGGKGEDDADELGDGEDGPMGMPAAKRRRGA